MMSVRVYVSVEEGGGDTRHPGILQPQIMPQMVSINTYWAKILFTSASFVWPQAQTVRYVQPE